MRSTASDANLTVQGGAWGVLEAIRKPIGWYRGVLGGCLGPFKRQSDGAGGLGGCLGPLFRRRAWATAPFRRSATRRPLSTSTCASSSTRSEHPLHKY
eukprot:1180433-Prorocentrum_minimum.AAC.1